MFLSSRQTQMDSFQTIGIIEFSIVNQVCRLLFLLCLGNFYRVSLGLVCWMNRVVTIKFVHSRKCKTRTFFVNEHLDATAKGSNERWRRIIKSLVSFSEKKATRLEFGGEFAWLRALRPNRLSVEFSLLFCFSSV